MDFTIDIFRNTRVVLNAPKDKLLEKKTVPNV